MNGNKNDRNTNNTELMVKMYDKYIHSKEYS